MINRILEQIIKSKNFGGKAIILIGARQTGKTTLLKSCYSGIEDLLWLDGDDIEVQAMFERGSESWFRAQFKGKRIVILDEAQRIRDIGIRLKLIIDHIQEIQLVASGSSAFELANKVNEPLTGRKWEYQLFPLSFAEMISHHGYLKEKSILSNRLIYGYYPEVVTNEGSEKEILKALSDSYLYKDILLWENIKKPDKLIKLLQALSFQIGNQVSYNELAQLINADPKTIEKYIDLLEKTYIIFRIGSFKRNLRNELKSSRKIYFYDNGIRNALISNFQLPELRQDIGALWENFLMSERKKLINYNNIWTNTYFWRTTGQQEIDYIEEKDGMIYAYEFKWNPKVKVKISKTFTRAYPKHEFKLINQENFDEFVNQKF